MSGRRSKTNGKTKKTENAVETTKDKNEKDVVTTSKETVSVTSTGNSRRQNAERIHCQRMRGNSAQATSPDNPRDMPLTQKGPDTMGTSMNIGAERPQKEMPPLESNPLSEEDARKLQREVKVLEETLSTTVASNEQKLANLGLELDAEKEKVLQIEKDKRTIQEECAKYKQELEELKGQPANIQVPLVACNDKEGTASDDEYKSMETTDTTTNVGAGVPPKSATPSTAEGEERHHQHHEIEFQKSVNKRSNIQISGQTAKLENPVEELQTRLLEVEAEKDAALQEKGRLAKEVTSLQQEMMAQVKRMEATAAKERSELEGECVRLRRECEALRDTKESLQGMLDENDVGSRGSFHALSVEDHLADASQPVSPSLEPKQQSSLQHSHSKMSSIRRHASCDATLSISDGDLEGSYCIIPHDGRPEDFHQGLTENAQTTASRIAPTDHRVTKLQREVDQLKIDKEDLQTRDEQHTSEITTLRAALAEVREENASRREHEAKLQSQCESSATRFDALQKRTKQLMKEAERDRSEVSVSRKQIQDLQAKCASLQQSLTHAVEESEARKQHEQILVQQMNEKLVLEQNHVRELDNEKKAKHELAEMCEQLQLQVKAYEEDFKAERHDRESAHDKFADREKKWMDELEKLTQERDRLTGNIFTLKDQLVAGKRELEARTKEAAKESTTVKALKEDFGTVVAKKDEEIQRMADLIRGLQPIADQYKVLFADNRDLQHQFDAVLRTNHEVQQMLRNMQSEKAAAESRVKELSMVVGQVTGENEALTQQNSHLVQQIEAFESMFSGMKSKSEALEQENTQLKEAICLPDLQITPRSSLTPPPQLMPEGRRSLPSTISQRYHQPVAHPPPPNRPPPPLHHNQDDYRQQGAAIHLTVEGQIAPYGKPHSEHGLIIMRDLPAHHDATAESDSPPLSKGDEQHPPQHVRDPYALRPPAEHPVSGDPRRAVQRDPRQPQFPYSGPSVLGSRAHAQPEFEHGPAAVGGDARPIKHPPSAGERYQAATQPPMDANQLHLHNSNSSASESSLSLPAPLTNRRRDSEATDPVQSGFEVNRRYIGEDINREIRHEARRYKEGNVAVEPAIADAEEWPFDPNLTCTFCGTMFRRGQIREFRYHIDECTARSMEGRK